MLLVVSLSGDTMGQDAKIIKGLKSYSCKDIMRFSGGDRDLAIRCSACLSLGEKRHHPI